MRSTNRANIAAGAGSNHDEVECHVTCLSVLLFSPSLLLGGIKGGGRCGLSESLKYQ